VSVRNIYYNLCISDGVIEGYGFGGAGTAELENGKREKGKLYFLDSQMEVLASGG
jgi:hypothetical protein